MGFNSEFKGLKLDFLDRFSKNTHIRFHGSSSSGSRVVLFGLTDKQTDMTKSVVALRNFACAPEKLFLFLSDKCHLSLLMCSLCLFFRQNEYHAVLEQDSLHKICTERIKSHIS